MLEEVKNSYDKEIRNLINRETDIVNNRMNWMILLHGLLFAGFYQVFDYSALFACMVPVVGILVSVVMKHAFKTNEQAIGFIMDRWNKFIKDNNYNYEDFPPVWAGAPVTWGDSRSDRFKEKCGILLSAHRSLPNIFIVAWMFNLIFCVVNIIK